MIDLSYSLLFVSADEDFVSGNYTITMKKNYEIACTTINITRDSEPEVSEYFTIILKASDQIKLGRFPEIYIVIVEDDGGTVVVIILWIRPPKNQTKFQ